MAAFTGTPVNGPVYTTQLDVSLARSENVEGAIQFARLGPYTHAAGAGIGEINLVKLPPGRIMVLPALSRIVSSAMVSTADLHIGVRAYTEEDGDAVSEDDNMFLDNADAGSAINTTFNPAAAGDLQVLDSQEGVIVFAMVDTANIEDTDTIDGWVAYVRLR
jgi:hypothetical protein